MDGVGLFDNSISLNKSCISFYRNNFLNYYYYEFFTFYKVQMVLQNRNNPVAIYKTDALVLIEKNNNNNKKHVEVSNANCPRKKKYIKIK